MDAGKTSLTERLLFDTGVIDRLGRVDAGDTQTDTDEIERERGITIRTAVASFRLGDLQVNLIDTPGHSDFIAEVERALGVLDAAILVLSAVEGVQPHTRILMKTLRRLRLPTLIFINKIDRLAARDRGLVADIQRKLLVRVVPINTVTNLGSAAARTRTVDWADPAVCLRAAEVLAEGEEALLQALVEETAPSCEKVQSALAKQTADASAHPLVFGSALTGAGVDCLLDTVQRFLPAATQREGALAGVVFSLTRNGTGEKLGYVRLFSGQLRNRQRVAFWRIDQGGSFKEHSGRITSLEVVGNDARPATAGNIAKVGGLSELRVGDWIGLLTTDARQVEFPRPDFESVVKPNAPADVTRLRSALMSLAEQDPLMQVRPLSRGGTSVLLYGEVQREVLAATLHNEFGIDADFAPPRIVHLERPLGVGEAMEARFGATIRLRIEPGPAGSGIVYRRARLTTSLLLSALLRAIEDTTNQ